MDQARENLEALRSLTQRVIDPSVAPYYADRTGSVSASAAFVSAIAIARLFKLDVVPSPGAYLLDGAALDNEGVRILGPGVYTRQTVIYTDKSVVLIHASAVNSMFRPTKGGWALDGLVFYDSLQTGLGATPDLTRPPLIQSAPGAPLIDWCVNDCVGINILDFIRNNPGSVIGDYRVTNNRIYAIRFAFWFREWQPEAGFISNNIWTPGVFEQGAIVANSAMLAKWSEANSASVAIDMVDATFNDTVDGWCSHGNLWFGGSFVDAVNGSFNMSSAVDIFDSVDRILSFTADGGSFGLTVTPLAGYCSQNRTPTVRTRAFEFATAATYIVSISGGRLHNSNGDGFVDTSTGRGLVTITSDVGTIGSAGFLTSGPATVTIASPGVWTRAGHGFVANRPVRLTTTGALPTGFTAGTVYYVRSPSTDTFQLSATPGGAAINATGSQSGVHTVTDAEAMYFARIDNPNAVYNIHCPSINNFGGFTECVGVSVVRAKQVNINGVAFEGMRNTIVVEDTQTVAGSVNIVGCQDLSQVSGARSLLVGSAAVSAGTVKARGNNWAFLYDVDDIVGSV